MRFIILILPLFFTFFQQPLLNNEQPLQSLAQLANEENLHIQSWQVVMDQKLSHEQFEQFMNDVKNDHIVTVLNENDTLKYTIESNDKEVNITYVFHAVLNTKNEEDITLKLVISGEHWDDKISHRYNELTSILQFDYSLEFGRTFTCLKMIDDVIIKNGSYYEELLNKLKITVQHEQYDNVHESTYIAEYYGYTALWDQHIVVNNEKINFQMAIKENENNYTEIIIGTPIVLNEY